MNDYSDSQWYRSGLIPKFGLMFTAIDARPLVLYSIWAFNPWKSVEILYLVTGVVACFLVAQYFGYKFETAVRRVRNIVAGRYRFTQDPKIRRRRFYSEY